MSEHLVKAGATVHVQECDSLSRVPYLNHWFCNSSAVVMLLTNGTLEVRSSVSLTLTCFPAETTGLFISPSGTSELDCATTKTDMAERRISIGRESLKVFLY